MRVYKFYEVKYQMNNLYWQTLAYFRKKEDAEEYIKSHNPKRDLNYPVEIVEHEFTNLKNLK